MKPLLKSLRILAVVSAAGLLGSCTEKLDNSGVCSILCPPIGGEVQNVTLDALALDTTVQALSGLGAEEGLLLATRGDTLDARVIVRFDSLPTTFAEGTDPNKPITLIDSASLRLLLDTLSIKGTSPVTIEAYDVDTTANDTSTAAVLALFRSDRLVTSQTYTRAQLRDSLSLALPGAHVLTKIQSGERLRLGLRAVSTGSTQLLFVSGQGGSPPFLRFRVSADTAVRPLIITPYSKTPADENFVIVANNLADYTVLRDARPREVCRTSVSEDIRRAARICDSSFRRTFWIRPPSFARRFCSIRYPIRSSIRPIASSSSRSWFWRVCQ